MKMCNSGVGILIGKYKLTEKGEKQLEEERKKKVIEMIELFLN